MPVKPEGVYPDGNGRWYFKATLGRDPLTGTRRQITRRGFRTAADAGRERREALSKIDGGQLQAGKGNITVSELLDEFLDGIDADGHLSSKTRFGYRQSADHYVRPHLGARRVRDVTPMMIQAWQRKLSREGGIKRNKPTRADEGVLGTSAVQSRMTGKPLTPNTVRLARAPLAGAFKLAVGRGMVATDPVAQIARPQPRRTIPKHWSPDQAREFLSLMDGDRTWALWAFLMGSGLRIGELVPLRWSNVDFTRHVVRVVEFVSILDHQVTPSSGKSRAAIRTIELDPHLEGVLRTQRAKQGAEKMATPDFNDSEYVFTKPHGGCYHPQWLSRKLGVYSSELGLPRLTAHGLRHTSATLMLANRVQPKVAAERLGHEDAALFMVVYSHVTETMQRDAAQRIGAALFA